LTVTDTNGNTLTYSDEGIFSSTGKSVTFERNAAGRIVTAIDPKGNKIQYEYDENGDLVGVTDREENTTRFEYDEEREHYLEEIIDPLGRTGVRTEYDESGRLKRMLDVNGEAVELVYDPDRSIQEVRDANGYPTFYQYDDRGNVVQVTNALGHSTYLEYDDRNNLIQLEDANGLITKYSYDTDGNITSRTESYCGCPSVVPGTTNYTYNQYGQTTSLVLSTGASLHMEYDNFGNMLSMKDGKGNLIQSFTYYSNGLVKSETDTTGTTTYEYDQFGNPIKTIDSDGGVITMEYNANGLLDKMVEDNGTPLDLSDDEISTFTYDKEGRQLRADYGNGIWVEYGYEGAGQDWTVLEAPTIGRIERKFTDDGKLAGWVTPDGGTPSFYYDEAGRLWRETDTSGKVITEYGYDPAGRLSSIKDVRTGATTLRKYDAGNRLIEEIAPLGSYTKSIYDPTNGKLVATERGQYLTDENTGELIVDSTTNEYVVNSSVTPQTWSYEDEGNRTTVTDPLGRQTTSVQDGYYLPTETIYQQRDGRDYRTSTSYLYDNNLQEAKDYPTRIVDIAGRDRIFTYDELGRLQTATDLGNEIYTYSYGQNGIDLIQSPLSITTSGEVRETLAYGYDDLGNLNRVTYGDGSSKLMSYLPTDNHLGTMTLPSGETIEYEYDEAGRVQSETTKTVDGTIASTVSYSYENGNIATVTDITGTTTYSYDSLTGSLSGIEYPNGSSIAYTYDLLGRVKTVAEKTSATGTEYVTQYGYDAFGNLETVQDPSGQITRMKYDVMNRLQERQLPNGVTTVYEYDELDRVKSIVHTNAQGEVVASVSYERSGIGEPTKITREDGSYVMLEYDEALRVKKESFYDAQGVLVDETAITYDAAGKRIVESSLNGGDRTFSYTAGYQLNRVESGEQTEDYDYDENGRLTSIYRNGEVLDLEHDASDRLTKVENQTTGETIEYTYDASGRRVAVTQDNEVRQFLVAPSMGSGLESTDLIADVHGNLISNYIYAGGASPFMRLDGNGNPIYYLTDAMGTAIGLVDGDGIEVGDLRYDSFGNLRSASGVGAGLAETGGDFRFQGQWLESETGLYHFRARDYDPKTGLFLSRDPVEPTDQQIEAFNPYQFAYNNPYVYSDPSGMITITEIQTTYQMQNILHSIEARAKEEIYSRFKDKSLEVAGEVFWNVLKTFAPLNSPLTDGIRSLNTAMDAGIEFEKKLKGQVRDIFANAGISLDQVFLEVGVNKSGQATGNWINFPNIEANIRRGESRLDYVLTPPSNEPRGRQGVRVTLGGPQRSYLIGDIKLQLKTIVNDYISNNGGVARKPDQWNAIANYARQNGYRIAGFVTLFGDSRRGSQQSFEQIAQKAAIRKGFTVFVVSILHGAPYSRRP
jgi:RHS repeat-associated protein